MGISKKELQEKVNQLTKDLDNLRNGHNKSTRRIEDTMKLLAEKMGVTIENEEFINQRTVKGCWPWSIIGRESFVDTRLVLKPIERETCDKPAPICGESQKSNKSKK